MTYQNKEYWEDRLRGKFSLVGTGHAGFSEYYNRYMYKLKAKALDRTIAKYAIGIKGRKVLDIGCGTGFFVDYYLRNSAGVLVGIDITDISVDSLKEEFPSARFYKSDISSEEFPLKEEFDLINVFDVLYHITDEPGFARAVKNIASCSVKGAHILITDALRPELGGASHVRYRSLKTYTDILGANGIGVLGVVPVFSLMSRNPAGFLSDSLLKRISARLIDSCAAVFYFLDSVYCPEKKSIMSLLVCKKL
ncbi:MAG: class I SAM-dependent methyltransferase [Candidatus Omnitrophica bacterium]|nr:class I SAM-dependent methyltransferase [Candidatus Omnitrophota bacterium]